MDYYVGIANRHIEFYHIEVSISESLKDIGLKWGLDLEREFSIPVKTKIARVSGV